MPKPASQAQTCSGCAPLYATTHLESQTLGRTQDSSPGQLGASTPPSPRPALHPVPARAHPAPNLAESKAEVAAASHTARTTTHKTTFRIDSSIAQRTSRA